MKKYQLWEEGFATNGESGTATFLGEVEAESFQEAFRKYVTKKYSDNEIKSLVNFDRLSIWGCRVYDNEKDARKLFG